MKNVFTFLALFFCCNMLIFAQPATPTNVTASPNVMCVGNSSTLNATSVGSVIYWWDSATAGILIGTSASGSNFDVTPTVTTTYYAEAVQSGTGGGSSQTFNYTGSSQTFTVPAGVTLLSIDAMGAQGSSQGVPTYGPGGNGGRVQTDLIVTPGSILNVYVGGTNTLTSGGWNGGGLGYYDMGAGGGGATDIRVGGITLADRVVVAGGGGGGGFFPNDIGGAGGDTLGGWGTWSGNFSAAYAGQGGGQTTGGDAANATNPTTGAGSTPGTFGVGGDGGTYGGAGGGAGYYGGGGGGVGGSGGGGSSYVNATLTSNTIHTQGYQTGDGQLIISYSTSSSSVSTTRTSVTIVVNTSSTLATSILASPSTINQGGSSNLSQTGGILGDLANWNWYDGSCGGTYLISGATIIQNPSVTTTYWVRAEGVCNTTLCISVTVIVIPTSVPDMTINSNDLNISPNPANNLIHILYNVSNASKVNIILYNIVGEKIIDIENGQKVKGEYKTSLNIQQFEAGIYMCKMIIDDKTTIVKRIVITK